MSVLQFCKFQRLDSVPKDTFVFLAISLHSFPYLTNFLVNNRFIKIFNLFFDGNQRSWLKQLFWVCNGCNKTIIYDSTQHKTGAELKRLKIVLNQPTEQLNQEKYKNTKLTLGTNITQKLLSLIHCCWRSLCCQPWKMISLISVFTESHFSSHGHDQPGYVWPWQDHMRAYHSVQHVNIHDPLCNHIIGN